MNIILKLIGRLGLLLTLLPSLLYLLDIMTLSTTKLIMIVGAIMWMAAAPIVQKRNKEAASSES